MAKKYKPTETELINDPSLRWNDYKWGEILQVDDVGSLRFIARLDGQVQMGTINGISPIGIFPITLVRRQVSKKAEISKEEKHAVLEGMSRRIR